MESTPFNSFSLFLADTEFAGQPELYKVFCPDLRYYETVMWHAPDLEHPLVYMNDHLRKYTVPFEGSSEDWVPCDLLTYINKDRAFKKRLSRFYDNLSPSFLKRLTSQEAKNYGYEKLGCDFLSWTATFVLLLNERQDLPPMSVSSEVMVGGYLKDAPDPKPTPIDVAREANEAAVERVALDAMVEETIELVESSLPSASGDEEEVPQEADADALVDSMSEVFVGEDEFVFLHDVEKCFGLREDEALSILAIAHEFPLVSDTLPVECAAPQVEEIPSALAALEDAVESAEHASVGPEEFKAVQAMLLAGQTPLEDTQQHSRPIDESKSSVDLSKPSDLVADEDQEVVLDIDEFASRQKGRGTFGKDASIAHYMGRIPSTDLAIVHASFTPEGRTQLVILKALSKVLCTSSVTANAHKIILVKKELVKHVFGSRLRGRVLQAVGVGLLVGASSEEMEASAISGLLPAAKKRRQQASEEIKRMKLN